MKFFIVGKHASGKHEVLDILEDLGVSVGRQFSNVPVYNPRIYMDSKCNQYSELDIERIFEQNSYIYIHGCEESGILDASAYQFGLSLYTLDNSDAVVLTPTEFLSANDRVYKDSVIIWLDNTPSNRLTRHTQERRAYSFIEREQTESIADSDFCKGVYNADSLGVLYFNNEDPGRVASVIYSILKYPDLLNIFINNYN